MSLIKKRCEISLTSSVKVIGKYKFNQDWTQDSIRNSLLGQIRFEAY